MNLFDGVLEFIAGQLAKLLSLLIGILPDSPLANFSLGPLASFGAIFATFFDVPGIVAFASAYAVALTAFIVFRLIVKFIAGGGYFSKLLGAATSFFGG